MIFLAAENSRRGPIDALDADFVPLYRTVLLSPTPPEGDVVVLASGSAARAYAWIGGDGPGGLDRPRDDARRAARSGSTVAVEAATHDLDGLVAAVAEYARTRVTVSTTSRS